MSALNFATQGSSASAHRCAEPFGARATDASPLPMPVGRTLPASISKGQAYYWSRKWQTGEQESRAEIKAGRGITFSTAEDAIRWLLSDDD